MIKDNVTATGKLSVLLKDENGTVKQQLDIKNLVVTVGKNLIASRLSANTEPVMSHIAVGTNTASPVIGNTALGAEIVGSRTSLTVPGGSRVDNTITYNVSLPAGVGTGAITEAGIFNSATVGTMLCRTTFPVVNKAAPDTLEITWNVTIS
jgi:hypothetical protein